MHPGEEVLVAGAAGGHHVRAPVHLGQLHREGPHPAGARMHQHPVPRPQIGGLQGLHESSPACSCCLIMRGIRAADDPPDNASRN